MFLAACANTRERTSVTDAELARVQFQKHCAACHGADGTGAEGGGPPLVRSSWVQGPDSRLIRIILHGVRGSIQVAGETYNREMLGFGQLLDDEDIASLLTFVRSRWGAPEAPVAPDDVGRIRKASRGRTEYWSVEELLEFR